MATRSTDPYAQYENEEDDPLRQAVIDGLGQTDDPLMNAPGTGENRQPGPELPEIDRVDDPAPGWQSPPTQEPPGPAPTTAPANVGHTGLWNDWNREQWRDAWRNLGQITPQAADEWLKAHGATEMNANSGVWTTPYGETYDLQAGRRAALANGGLITTAWNPVGETAAGAGGDVLHPGPGVPGKQYPLGGAGGSEYSSTTGAPGSDGGAIWESIRNLISQDPYSASIEDPQLRGASEAYRRAQERARRERREAAAERLGAQGVNSSGAMDTAIERGYQDYGNATSAYDANLVLTEMTARRDQLMKALSLGAGLLTSEQERALRWQLAQLDASLQEQRMAQQNQQYYDELGFRIGDRDTYWQNYPYTVFS